MLVDKLYPKSIVLSNSVLRHEDATMHKNCFNFYLISFKSPLSLLSYNNTRIYTRFFYDMFSPKIVMQFVKLI